MTLEEHFIRTHGRHLSEADKSWPDHFSRLLALYDQQGWWGKVISDYFNAERDAWRRGEKKLEYYYDRETESFRKLS